MGEELSEYIDEKISEMYDEMERMVEPFDRWFDGLENKNESAEGYRVLNVYMGTLIGAVSNATEKGYADFGGWFEPAALLH